MKFRGLVMNGVVVLDAPGGLTDGTVVEVEPVGAPGTPRRGSAEAILRRAGTWESPAEEVGQVLQELRRSRHAEQPAAAARP